MRKAVAVKTENGLEQLAYAKKHMTWVIKDYCSFVEEYGRRNLGIYEVREDGTLAHIVDRTTVYAVALETHENLHIVSQIYTYEKSALDALERIKNKAGFQEGEFVLLKSTGWEKTKL